MKTPYSGLGSGAVEGWPGKLAPIVVAWLLLLSGCRVPSADSGSELARTERALQATQTALAGTDRPSQTPGPTDTSTALAPASTDRRSTASATGPTCAELADQVGRTVTCVIAQAHCSYREDIEGAPTFCNDVPFPSHDFTLLVWGQDWSEFDGRCLVVSGFLSRFEGQPQIVAESRSQVSFCG